MSLDSLGQANLKFKDTKKSFGFVKQGQPVKLVFDFVNIGNEPLFIYDASAECACTQIEFSVRPYLPNESGQVIVLFDTKSARDRQNRVVEISSNSNKETQKIRFKGVVLSK